MLRIIPPPSNQTRKGANGRDEAWGELFGWFLSPLESFSTLRNTPPNYQQSHSRAVWCRFPTFSRLALRLARVSGPLFLGPHFPKVVEAEREGCVMDQPSVPCRCMRLVRLLISYCHPHQPCNWSVPVSLLDGCSVVKRMRLQPKWKFRMAKLRRELPGSTRLE